MPKPKDTPSASNAETYAALALQDIQPVVDAAISAEANRKQSKDPFKYRASFALASYTLWLADYAEKNTLRVSCVAGEPTSADFQRRITAVELRGIVRQYPATAYLVARRETGRKKVDWSIIDADKYRSA
jgi:hypothetical protein